MVDALIFGVRGQDGRLLSDYLLKQGLTVLGGSRTGGLIKAGNNTLKIVEVHYPNLFSVVDLLKNYKPRFIFNFAANSSVGYSFANPYESQISYILPLQCILESIRLSGIETRLFVANSGEVFGNTNAAKVGDKMNAHSPYALARVHGANLCKLYRELYHLDIVTGYLFPHESYHRGEMFFLPKLVKELTNIKSGKKTKAYFGDLSGIRDFSWAQDFMEGFLGAMLCSKTDDYIFASGRAVSLQCMVDYTLKRLDLDNDCVECHSHDFTRKSDLKVSVGNPIVTKELLNWNTKISWEEIIEAFIEKRYFENSLRSDH